MKPFIDFEYKNREIIFAVSSRLTTYQPINHTALNEL